MQQPTILQLCSIKGRGGTGYMMSRLCRLLSEQGARVIVGSCEGSKVEERSREAGLELLSGLQLRRGFRPGSLFSDIKKIRNLIKTAGVDIVHAWHSIEYWTAACAVIGTKAKVVRTRGLVTPVKGSFVNKFLHNRTAFVHVTCSRILENYRAGGFDMDKVKLVHDGVDISRFYPESEAAGKTDSSESDRLCLRSDWNISEDAVVIAAIGRLEKVKGHKHLFDAVKIMQEKGLKFYVVMAGDGSLRKELEKRAVELGISDSLRFLGVRSDIPEILRASDIFVLTSIGSEGSSRATQEAMACAHPAVTSHVGMLPDIVRENENGFLTEIGNAENIAEKLSRLVESSDLRQKMSAAALDYAKKEFDERLFASRILDLYRQALQG